MTDAVYSFKTSSIAIPFLAEYADSLPILLNCNKQLDKEFKGGTGTTMTMIIPDHPEIGTGATLTEADGDYASGSKTLTLVQNHVWFGANQVQQALDISDLRGQVAKPYGAKLGSYIQKAAARTVQLKAAHQIVMSGTTFFEQVGGVIASIRASRSFDDLFGCLSPVLNSKVIGSGISFFNPSSQISEMFKNARLGVYNTAEFYTSPDVVSLTTGTLALGGSTVLKVKTTMTAGQTTLVLKVVGGTATMTGTIAAGQGITIAGVDAVDIYGDSVGTKYCFVAQALATAAGNEISVIVKPIYTKDDSKPLNNVSAYPEADMVCTMLQESNASYLGGIIWDKQSLMFGSAKLAPISGTEEDVFSDGANGLSITVTRGPDITKGRQIMRMDTLTGFELVRDNWAGVVWLKVA
jgi:hypothetical protein